MTVEPGGRGQLWKEQFSEVDREILKMASLGGVDVLDRSHLRRVLDKDAGACTRSNELAFEKLHRLLQAHYLLRDRAVAAIGAQAAQDAIDQTLSELKAKFMVVGKG